MKTYSLRWRLLAGGMVAILVALAIAWFAMTYLFARHVSQRVEVDLQREGVQLVARLAETPAGIAVTGTLPDHRFERPASGVYWQVSDGRQVVRSRSLWDQELDRRSRASMRDWHPRMTRGPFEETVLLVERRISVGGAPAVLVQVGQDARDLHEAREEFGRELALFLALLWLVLSAAAWVQVTIGLRALDRVGEAVRNLKRRPGERLAGDHPSEVKPLVDAINAFADARESDVRRARQRAADLAHAMKTPIAALSAQSRRLAEGGGSTEGLDRTIASVAAAVETELARSRAAASRQGSAPSLASPATVARRLIAVLERTEKGSRIDFLVELDDGFRLPVEEPDLTEMLGALLENAARFARRQVVVSGGADGDGGSVRIDDDGPGMDPADAERVLGRGIRLDERGGGHGLGISIARELADATEGELRLGRADHGGLRAELHWAG